MTYSIEERKNNEASTPVLTLNSELKMESEALTLYLMNYLKPCVLNDLQEKVIRNTLEGKTYIEISKETHNDPDYLKGVGAKLWKILSDALGEEVTKRNIKLVAKRNYKRIRQFNQSFQQETNNIPKVTNLPRKSQTLCNETVNKKYRDWGDAVDVSCLYGRATELTTLKKWILHDCCRLIALLGMGGIGKTSLASMLAKQIESEFEVVIWKSLRNAPEFKSLLAELIVAICDRQSLYIADTIDGQINNLMQCLRQKRCLLILDSLDNILASEKLGGQYLAEYQGYGQLLRRIQDEQHQSCIVITSREKPTGLSLREGSKSLVRSHLIESLSMIDALQIIGDRDLVGSISTQKRLVSCCGGNPLILKIAIATIKNLFDSEISYFLNYNLILYGEIWQLIDRQYQRLTNSEKQVLKYIYLRNNELDLEIILAEMRSEISAGKIIKLLISLQNKSLIKVENNYIKKQSILNQYIITKVF